MAQPRYLPFDRFQSRLFEAESRRDAGLALTDDELMAFDLRDAQAEITRLRGLLDLAREFVHQYAVKEGS